MFTSAAAAAFSPAGTAIVSAVSAITAIVLAAVVFSVDVAVKKCFAFSAGKNLIGFFIKTQTGRSIPALFIYAMVTDEIAVGNFLSAFSAYCDSVRDKIMSPSAVFAFTFMFHWQKPFQLKINLYKLYHYPEFISTQKPSKNPQKHSQNGPKTARSGEKFDNQAIF